MERLLSHRWTTAGGALGAASVIIGDRVANILTDDWFAVSLIVCGLVVFVPLATTGWRTFWHEQSPTVLGSDGRPARIARLPFHRDRIAIVFGCSGAAVTMTIGIAYFAFRPEPIDYQLRLAEFHEQGVELRSITKDTLGGDCRAAYEQYLQDYNAWLFRVRYWIRDNMDESSERRFIQLPPITSILQPEHCDIQHAHVLNRISYLLGNIVELSEDAQWR